MCIGPQVAASIICYPKKARQRKGEPVTGIPVVPGLYKGYPYTTLKYHQLPWLVPLNIFFHRSKVRPLMISVIPISFHM